MKGRVLQFGLLVVLVSLGVAAAPLGLCDYVSPQTDLRHLSLSASYRHFVDGSGGGADVSGGRAALDFGQLYDSPDIGFTLAGSAEVLLADFLPTGGLGEALGTFRYFLSADLPFFGFGGIETSLASTQSQPRVHVSAGMGYGRFSDVTPLAKAFRISNELLKAKAISQPLGDSVRMALAKAIGTKYASVKDQIADVVNQIQSAAAVTVTARQVLIVEDVVLATGDERRCGWSIQAGVGYKLLDPFGAPQDLLVTASADAALAPDPAGQLLFRASVSGPLDLLNENTLTAHASYDYVLSDTSSLRLTYSLQHLQPRGGPASTSHAAAALVGFAVGRANVGLQLSLSKGAADPAWSLDASISVAMSLL
ncbi:MAG: hypothetical protein NT125_03785 [Candidatus Bipolaricaulota bacterium]|nr:hypothetical protein [Candidatus Bipolaricaulota bacterium]